MRAHIVERQIPIRHLKFLRENFDKLVLAYSGGSDSTLLLLVCLKSQIRLDGIVFCNTRIEYPEIISYVHMIIEKLKLASIFHEIYPELTASELGKLIIEDFDKVVACAGDYDKSDYRCCYYAKEKPMRGFLKQAGLDREDVCILRGFRLVDNSNRMLSGLTLIETGQFYFHNYKHSNHAKTANPLWTVTDEAKKRWLDDLTQWFKIPMPTKTGCMICPIYYQYASKEEKQDARYQIAARFIERGSVQKIPHYLEV